jgi:hypothetical protein
MEGGREDRHWRNLSDVLVRRVRPFVGVIRVGKLHPVLRSLPHMRGGMSRKAASMIQSESIQSLAGALALAQGELEDAGRGRQANGYKYADLGAVLAEVRPVFSRHGLSVVQCIARDGNTIIVSTQLCHESGEWIRGEASAPLVIPTRRDGSPTMTDIQAMGSVTTYLRRYSLAAICGITQIDDDGAMSEEPEKSVRNFQSRQQSSVQVSPMPAHEEKQAEIPIKPMNNPNQISGATLRTLKSAAVATFGREQAADQCRRLATQLNLPADSSQLTEAQGLQLIAAITRLS